MVLYGDLAMEGYMGLSQDIQSNKRRKTFRYMCISVRFEVADLVLKTMHYKIASTSL